MSSSATHDPPVFCAIVDSAYFLGAVALVNSLRLTGHSSEIVFLDVGLEDYQRALLEREATIHDGPMASGWLSVLAKAMLGLLYPDRTVLLMDNDLVITASLEPLVDAARAGNIAVFEEPDPTRWFAEWEELFSLRKPLRRQPYVNSGCVALSTGHWRGLLERWYELGESIATERAGRPFLLRQQEADAYAISYPDQDTLNALLMSEVPESAVRFWAHSLTPHWSDRRDVRVVDLQSLRCDAGGELPIFLHCTGQPKPWQPKGWLRQRFLAFNRLLTRVLVGEDVPLRLPRGQIPRWLREGFRGRLLETSGAGVAWLAHESMAIVPEEIRARVVAPIRARISGTGARA